MKISDYPSSRSIYHPYIGKFVFFIIWPFGSFLYSLLNMRKQSSYMIFFLFGVLFCWHMNPNTLSNYDDFFGTCDVFLSSHWTFSDLINQFVALITFDQSIDERDVYQNFLSWFTKLFTDRNYHLMFAFASVLYLYFSLKSLKFITRDEKFECSLISFAIVLLFVIPRDIVTVQNPRFTTAIWCLVFAVLSFCLDGNKRNLLFLLLACIIHTGTAPLVAIIVVGYLCKKYINIVFIIFCLSIPFSLAPSVENLGMDLWFIQFLPPLFREYIEVLFSANMYEQLISYSEYSGFIWVQLLFTMLVKLSHIIIVIMLWLKKDTFKQDKNVYGLFGTTLVIFTIVNYIQFVPIMGERYMWLCRILAIYLFFKVFYKTKYENYVWCLLFTCSYYIFMRWFFKGAAVLLVSHSIYYLPLPYLIYDYWGAEPFQPPFF